ncbi:MAG: glutaredoxin family protein [Candidatus Accumulibacter sp.]|jgi:glutaredoxin|nr:glutaredoxin family protein [Accumulibacter sp.]
MSAFRCLVFFCAFAALLPPCGAQTTTYRWVDKTGQTVYSDKPPAPGTPYTTEIRRENAEEGDRQLPYATRQAAAKYPVTLYTSATCRETCANARAMLNTRGVPFTERMLTNSEEVAEVVKQMGTEAFVPGIRVGTQNFPGFDAGSWHNLLDLAGYPKTAPYGAKPSGAFAK